MVKETVYLVTGIIAILWLGYLGSSTNNSVLAQSANVNASIVYGASSLTDTAYSPNPIEIMVNQSVLWTNDDFTFHTVTSGSAGAADAGKAFDSGLAGPTMLSSQGKTFEHTFEIPGEYPYFCILHPAMVGIVIVK
ncbi:cupredoxin domain-containing protein [Candidatus Nitrosocosmicus hydrocola]|uniref:cupredoxin domain-containing protein n=1 Tax=Candidatus Nitrosocosmicus hydrocola TaxID=1826872 RepID=UPI0011E5FCFE|nr:plastocyanin/azurin family copper-binding protein [Candidatus Nitrosocosmicus hydrocola]